MCLMSGASSSKPVSRVRKTGRGRLSSSQRVSVADEARAAEVELQTGMLRLY